MDNINERINELKSLIKKKEDTTSNQENITVAEEDKKRAAYALNMCMVSVSQIVDYEDINVLDQEYDAILNNLNLEKIPKDEALLHILKQLLDTITYFRIQEGDKKLIEKEYQQKVKNAIWNAVPKFGLFVAGVDPFTMALSLASQVGIGYMNYRRCKAANELEFERQQWQLQRSAIEQFNALRRELFDTSWRLADKYGFADNYRLTERQIKQFNTILMDTDEIRKYERLKSIEDKFEAYPPFWYFYGNTANYIAESFYKEDGINNKYRKEALKHFQRFEKLNNKYNILREDQLSAACALEHVEILLLIKKELTEIEKELADTDKDKIDMLKEREGINLDIEKLLGVAVNMAGNNFDILQICAIHYLRINKKEPAEKYLRLLVNEDYNKIINAQLLSGIYVANKDKYKDDYDLLKRRVGEVYLYPMPNNNEDRELLENSFYNKQRELLKKKYNYLFELFKTRAKNELLKSTSISVEKNGNLLNNIDKVTFNYKKEFILAPLKTGNYRLKIFHILNDFLDCFFDLPCFKSGKPYYKAMVRLNLNEKEINKINDIQRKIENSMEFTYDDYKTIHEYNPLDILSKDFIKNEENRVLNIINEAKIEDIQNEDTELLRYCDREKIILPELATKTNLPAVVDPSKHDDFLDISIFGKEATSEQNVHLFLERLRNCAEEYCKNNPKLLHGNEAKIYVKDEIDKYYFSKPELPVYLKQWAIMVIEDTRDNKREDLIIVPYGTYIIKKGKIDKYCNGNSLKMNSKKEIIIKEGRLYDDTYINPSIDNNELVKLSQELVTILSDDNKLWNFFMNAVYNNK